MFARLSRHLTFVLWLFVPMPALAQSDQAVEAIRLASQQGYTVAYAAVDESDAVTRDVLTWLRLSEGGQPFADYAPFLNSRADWPRLDRIRSRGERAMPAGLPAETVIDWFGDTPPETGEGAVHLARALMAVGQQDRAEAVLMDVWTRYGLSGSDQAMMVSAFGDLLTPLAAVRADAMLWRWRTEDAERLVPLLDDDMQKLVAARIALIRDSASAADRMEDVPEPLSDNPGLAYDRYNWLADKGRRDDAIAILLAKSTSADALGEPFRWSGWRRTLTRWEMRNGDPARAYQIAANHFLTDDEGSAYTDLEWLAGYISLTYLDAPEQALAHFENGMAIAATPITLSRMGYWIGRANEALDRAPEAEVAYTMAGPFQTAFYGLLAAEKLGHAIDPALTGAADARDWAGAPVLSDDLVRAALTLMEAGRHSDAIAFFVAAVEKLDAADLGRLGAYLEAKDQTNYEVLLGKSAVNNGIIVPSIYFPIHDMAEMEHPVDPALALAIARRESEFLTGAGSPVGAQGLMQLMPATAREVSGWVGEPYSADRLTGDWVYNATLGSRYLAELEQRFGKSPVMVAAGYNAGPSRPITWMNERGDPRTGDVDVVDWIEHIPFSETRNYVMRVTESLPVYRARLRGELGPVRFTTLLNGQLPVIRPIPRPDLAVTVSTSQNTVTPLPVEEATTPSEPLRAIARPEIPLAPEEATPTRPQSRPVE